MLMVVRNVIRRQKFRHTVVHSYAADTEGTFKWSRLYLRLIYVNIGGSKNELIDWDKLLRVLPPTFSLKFKLTTSNMVRAPPPVCSAGP